MVGFGIRGVEPSGCGTTVFVNTVIAYCPIDPSWHTQNTVSVLWAIVTLVNDETDITCRYPACNTCGYIMVT